MADFSENLWVYAGVNNLSIFTFPILKSVSLMREAYATTKTELYHWRDEIKTLEGMEELYDQLDEALVVISFYLDRSPFAYVERLTQQKKISTIE